MLKKLKRKFIIINMTLVGLVVIIVFCAVCGYTYTENYSALRSRLENAVNAPSGGLTDLPEIGGGFEDFFGGNGGFDMFGSQPSNTNTESLAPSVVVFLDKDNTVLYTVEYYATISDESLESAVEKVLASGKELGTISEMNMMFLQTNGPVKKIAFTSTRELHDAMKTTFLAGLLICFVVLTIMFAVSLLLSSLAIKPVGEAWSKQKQFIADASHELKTPLTVILANNNILQSHPEDTLAEQQQWLESTQEEASRMKKLIDQMLFLAKSDAEQSPVVLSKINISEITERCALSFEPVAFEKGVTIHTSVSPDIVISSESSLYDRLLHILIDNAVKHAETGGFVTIALHKNGTHTFLSVNNTGSLISDEDLPHIFDRFYRADKARTSDVSSGYGLGLAIAKNILISLGGDITVSSTEEKGTTFIVMF